jgi:glycosyltransferase involved in cell wall biosynthesis
MVQFIYDRCELVLGQSRKFSERIANYCTEKDKIRYFPSWAEDVFSAEGVVPASEVTICANSFNVVFAGNIGEAQDMPAVLAAAEHLKDSLEIRWIIVGDGRKSGWLQKEISRRCLQDKVLLLGRFPVERMPSFYAHADALLVSLKKDPVFSMTIPGKVQSYLMSGLPLLGMLDGEGADVIRDADAGFACNAGDSIGLAQAVQALAAMSVEERQRLGRNGREYAQREFGRAHLVDKLDGFLQEAVARRKKI